MVNKKSTCFLNKCFLLCGGDGGIRTHGGLISPQTISSRSRYDHFATSPDGSGQRAIRRLPNKKYYTIDFENCKTFHLLFVFSHRFINAFLREILSNLEYSRPIFPDGLAVGSIRGRSRGQRALVWCCRRYSSGRRPVCLRKALVNFPWERQPTCRAISARSASDCSSSC